MGYYFGDYWRPSVDGVAVVTPPSGVDSAPVALSSVYCSDEAIALRAPADYTAICPRHQCLAAGSDGVFEALSPWVMTSVLTDFLALGVTANSVVALRRPAAAFGTTPGGQLFAVNQAGTNQLVLRRLGEPLGKGQPPAPAGLVGVEFAVLTFGPQIDIASFDANEMFGIDASVGTRAPVGLYRVRELEQFTVLKVLRWAYVDAMKSKDSDYAGKLSAVASDLSDVLGRLHVRWGADGSPDPEAGSIWSARLRR